MERREVACAGAPARPLVEELGPGERPARRAGRLRDHSSRYSTKSSRLASAHCMSSNTRTVGYVSASRSKKSRQAAKRSSRSCDGPLLERRAGCASTRLDERAARPDRACARSSVASSFSSAAVGIVVVLGDAGAHAHHVGERPVGDALAVGEAAAAVPVDVVDEPVEVLVELPRQPRLADPGDARSTRRDARVRSSAEAWKSSLTSRSSRSRPTNGGSRPVGLERAAARRRRRAARARAALPRPCPSARARRRPRRRSLPRSRAAWRRRRARCPGRRRTGCARPC